MNARLLLLLLFTAGCSSAPRIESVELTRDTLRLGEEAFLTMAIADDEAELNPPKARVTLLPAEDEEPLETEVLLPTSPEGATGAQVILGLSFTGAVLLGGRAVEVVVIDSGGAESEAWPLSLRLDASGPFQPLP